ncbi:Catechol 2,3-dioxygenase [Raineyella antarctica]|uniref:Catechol 2,3-dioxygenase n=1 Tax=Raineyella antarctica TaxID=1577474 RepID=A0A1G6GDF7_9ACTN|nr:VOC family protein [Raineyella antarctica]SDB79765.1 Catechol 2,3-dioxygenase [Raineyella antarctica]
MLGEYASVATLPVKDLTAAAEFYETKLGFKRQSETDFEGGVFYCAGKGMFFVYESTFAGTNQATAMTFQVPPEAFDAEVEGLRSAGVTLETFEMPGLTWSDGVATMDEGGGRAVWFKDPDGNFINVDEIPAG